MQQWLIEIWIHTSQFGLFRDTVKMMKQVVAWPALLFMQLSMVSIGGIDLGAIVPQQECFWADFCLGLSLLRTSVQKWEIKSQSFLDFFNENQSTKRTWRQKSVENLAELEKHRSEAASGWFFLDFSIAHAYFLFLSFPLPFHLTYERFDIFYFFSVFPFLLSFFFSFRFLFPSLPFSAHRVHHVL